jgi:hypothetical protein
VSWTTMNSFCGTSGSSMTCGAGKVCVGSAAAPVCVQIPTLNASCPGGYGPGSGGTVANWYTANQYSDTRSCSCSCNPTRACTANGSGYHLGQSGCPITSALGNCVATGAGTCDAYNTINSSWGNPLNAVATFGAGNSGPATFSCTTAGTVGGGSLTASTTAGYTICCQ